MEKTPTFCLLCTANHYENLENASLKLETVFTSRGMTDPSGRLLGHSLQKMLLKLLQSVPENLVHTQKTTKKTRLSLVNFIKKVDQSHISKDYHL